MTLSNGTWYLIKIFKTKTTLFSEIGIKLSHVPPVNTVQHGGRTGSLWDCIYGRQGIEFSAEHSTKLTKNNVLRTLTSSLWPFIRQRAHLAKRSLLGAGHLNPLCPGRLQLKQSWLVQRFSVWPTFPHRPQFGLFCDYKAQNFNPMSRISASINLLVYCRKKQTKNPHLFSL